MKLATFLVGMLLLVLLALMLARLVPRTEPPVNRPPMPVETSKPLEAEQPVVIPRTQRPEKAVTPQEPTPAEVTVPALIPPPALTKLERLAQVREKFTALAAGDPKLAFAAARQLTDETERETALMALVTVWKKGDLSPAKQRASAIASLGLEAGLGLELAKDPSLALMWANELTDGENRTTLIDRAAMEMLQTNAMAALSLIDQVSPTNRRASYDVLLTAWAEKDTDEALGWAQQLTDPEERDAAMRAIRQAAPVGIGTTLKIENGYAIVGDLLPGAPAALSGQIHPGDRIVGVAQGDSQFIDARGIPLSDLVQAIRGAPGSLVQLQIVPGDALDSVPRTVTIIRDQIRRKTQVAPN